ncbi:glycosyltransferase [Aquabacterium fontiphilum]|jgi:alpha-1,6-mannosyltransferase|uniref:glycosyltransferase n=1 Tax=Aquabacterium fontiphilum TaxID=450365 RepID=UPI001376F5AA|nr:glycosyltransferase [Aquabacterium fontiphilum]NBD22126.1 glycosyltransferase [Aquabacterium fontiphilum]
MPHVMDVTMFWGRTSGGVRSYVLAKRNWISACRDWQHTVAAPGVSGAGMLALPGMPLPFSGGYRAPLARRANGARLARQRPDLFEIGDPFTLAWSALDAARQLRVPVVAFCHANVVSMARRFGGAPAAAWARRYLCKVYARCDLVLAPSHDMVAQLRDWGLPHVEHQPLGVDTAVFQPAHRSAAWRAELGLSPDTRVLLYAGRFAPEKNLQTLCEAVRALGPNHVLVAMGDGPVPPRGPGVLRLPFTNDRRALARAMASADVFVHAGDQETCGLTVLEAMACGCPVVARGTAGLRELVNEQVGYSVSDGHPVSFAHAVTEVLNAPRAPLSQAAVERARAQAWGAVLPRLFGRYQSLLENTP